METCALQIRKIFFFFNFHTIVDFFYDSNSQNNLTDYKESGHYSGVAVDKTKIMIEGKTTTSLIKGNKVRDDVKLLGPHSLVISSSKSVIYFAQTWHHPSLKTIYFSLMQAHSNRYLLNSPRFAFICLNQMVNSYLRGVYTWWSLMLKF